MHNNTEPVKMSFINFLYFASLALACNNEESLSDVVENTTIISDENIIPTESTDPTENECNNDFQCFEEEICFKKECNYSGALVYETSIRNFIECDQGCKNYKYYIYLDKQFVFESSVSKCGADWPNNHFEMHGDQILEIIFTEVRKFQKDNNILQACFKEPFLCSAVPFEFLKTGKYLSKIENMGCKYSFEIYFKPVKSLEIDL